MRKAQFAMEYLLVVGFSLLIIIPLITLLHQQYQEQQEELAVEHLTEIARELTYQAEKLYYQGAPSSTTVEASFPKGIEGVIITNYDITFEHAGTDASIYAISEAPLQGTLRTYPGRHVITLTVNDQDDNDPGNDFVLIRDD